ATARARRSHRRLRLPEIVRRARRHWTWGPRDRRTPKPPPAARARVHHARAREADAAVARALRSRRDERDADRRAPDLPHRRHRVVTAEEFVLALAADNDALLARLAPDDTLKPEVDGALNVPNLLKVALKNEVEATE